MVPRVLTTNGKQAFLPVLMVASLSLIGRPSKLVALKDISATVGLLRLIVDTMKLSKSNFRALDCRDCPSCDKCTRSVPPRRTLTIRPQEQYLALQQARDLLTTKQSTRGSSMNGTGNNDKGRSLYQTCIFDLVNKRIREKQCFLNLSCSLCSLLKCVYHAQKFLSLFPVPFILDPLFLLFGKVRE